MNQLPQTTQATTSFNSRRTQTPLKGQTKPTHQTPTSSTPVTPTSPNQYTSTSSSSSSKKKIDPTALALLLKIPGTSATALQQCLYLARIVPPTEEIYDHIISYVSNGCVHNYTLKVINIIRLVRDNDVEFDHDDNLRDAFRMMLWHGTKENVVGGILQNGFKIPTNKNQMFGTGIYFADRSSKSTNYCGNTSKGSFAYLFLCDVVVGSWYNAKNAKNAFNMAPKITTKAGVVKPCDSVKCTGANIPDENEQVDYYGSIIPLGKTIKNTKYQNYTVQHNEFIIYDSTRVKMKYLVKVQFT